MPENATIKNIWDAVGTLDGNGEVTDEIQNLHFVFGISSTDLSEKIDNMDLEESLVLEKTLVEGYGKKPLLFMSYGKPTRKKDISSSPVFLYFEIEESTIDGAKVLPFNSQVFREAVLKRRKKDVDECIAFLAEHFEIDCLDREKLNNYVCCIFGDCYGYYESEAKKRIFRGTPTHPEINDYIDIILNGVNNAPPDLDSLHWQLSTLEVQYFDNIDCKSKEGFKLKYVMCSEENLDYYKNVFSDVEELKCVPYDIPSFARGESFDYNMVDLVIYQTGMEIIKGRHV